MHTYLLHFFFFHKYFHWRKSLPLLCYLKPCPLPLTLTLTLTQTLTLTGGQFVRGQLSGHPRFYINLRFFTFSLNQLLQFILQTSQRKNVLPGIVAAFFLLKSETYFQFFNKQPLQSILKKNGFSERLF